MNTSEVPIGYRFDLISPETCPPSVGPVSYLTQGRPEDFLLPVPDETSGSVLSAAADAPSLSSGVHARPWDRSRRHDFTMPLAGCRRPFAEAESCLGCGECQKDISASNLIAPVEADAKSVTETSATTTVLPGASFSCNRKPEDLTKGGIMAALVKAVRIECRRRGLPRETNPPLPLVAEVLRLERASIAPPTLYKWCMYDCAKLSDDDLTPENCAPVRMSRKKDPFAAALDDLPGLREHLIWLYMQTLKASGEASTHERATGTKMGALARLGDFPALMQARPELAEQLRSGAQPVALLRVLHGITPGHEARARGARHTQLHTLTGRRALEIELEDGRIIPVEPGKVWVFDDMSDNWPFWFELPEWLRDSLPQLKSHPMIARHGVGVGRQTLSAMDVGSAAWIGTMNVGRVRDSYTSALILRFVCKLMDQYGKPDWLIFEKGNWAARKIKGWATDEYAEESFTTTGLGDEDKARLQDGLSAIGVRIHYCFSPHGPGKAMLESSFRYLQSKQGTFFNPGEGVNIGSHAGEFERATKRQDQARAGVRHARDLGFVHTDRSAEVRWTAMRWLNERPRECRAGQVPLELLANGPSRPALTQNDKAVFLPESRPLTIRGGHVWPQANGMEFSFIAPELFATLGNGYRVVCKFDPATPAMGAAIYNAETGAHNHINQPPGALLGWAELHEDAPLISLRDRGEDEGLSKIKRYRAAERTAFRAYHLPTLKTVRASAVRDGRGNTATVSDDTASAAAPRPIRRDVAARPQSAPAACNPRLAELMAERETEFAPA